VNRKEGAHHEKSIGCSGIRSARRSARAGEDSTDRWFNEGLAWYEHPCGMRAFDKYGQDDRLEVRHAYELTKHHPELCSKLLP
jgi:hypothetical protein